MECTIEAAKRNITCWNIEGLPDMIDEGRLAKYSVDHDEYIGPRCDEIPKPNGNLDPCIEGANIRYKWKRMGPNHSRLNIDIHYSSNFFLKIGYRS